jgi:hypothetical protein
MGKGSKQRPSAVPDKELQQRWDQVFGGKKKRGQ